MKTLRTIQITDGETTRACEIVEINGNVYLRETSDVNNDALTELADDSDSSVNDVIADDGFDIVCFANFTTDGNNAFATGTVLDSHLQETHQEWCERGTVNGTAVEVYWLFENPEADCEDGADMPFDEDHIDRIEIVEA